MEVLQCALPIWAAAEMGARRVIAVNVLPDLPSRVIKTTVSAIRNVRPFRPLLPQELEVVRIDAPTGMGSAKDALYWKRDNVERWIELGEAETGAAIRSGSLDFEVKREHAG